MSKCGGVAFLLTVLFSVAVLAVGEATAEPGSSHFGRPGAGYEGFGHGPGRMLPMLLRSAELNPEQSAKVKDLVDSRRPAFEKLFDKLRRAHEGVADLIFSSGELDATALDAQVDEVGAARTALMREGIKTAVEVRTLLSPEQRAKVAEAKDRLQRLRLEMRDIMGDPASPPH